MSYQFDDAFYAKEAAEIARELGDRTPSVGGLAPMAPARVVHLTRASSIRPRRVRWLWQDRAPLGALVLLAGREGIGKSVLVYTFAAQITQGTMPGTYFGLPRSVIVAATEDSWEYTIVPRLMAAGADLDRVCRVDVTTADLGETELSLPRDLASLESAVRNEHAAIILDPLMSRLDVALDSHKDGEVRQALEPLVTLADRTAATVLGLIHVNKGGSSDPLTSIMGSRAFAAVARSVLFVMTDPDDEKTRLLGTPKNNLGRSDLPTLSFQIVGVKVAETEEGDIWTGKVEWTGESDRSIRDAMQVAAEVSALNKTVVGEASDWLTDYLSDKGGSADSADIKRDGAKAGHSQDALKRARLKLKVVATSVGFPRRTHWTLQSVQAVGAGPGETSLIQLTTPTAPTEGQSAQSVQSGTLSRAHAPTGTNGEPFVFNPRGAY